MSSFHLKLSEITSGESTRRFCQRLDIKHSTFYTYLTGSNEPTLSNLLKIADAAGVSLDWLAGREGAAKEFSATAAARAAAVAEPMLPPANLPSELIEIPVWRGAARGLEYMAFRAAYLNHRLRIAPDELTLVPVATADAAPVFVAGSVCICHACAAPGEGVWAFECGSQKDTAYFRRARARARTGSEFALQALTADGSETEVISAAALHKAAIGKIVWGERFFK